MLFLHGRRRARRSPISRRPGGHRSRAERRGHFQIVVVMPQCPRNRCGPNLDARHDIEAPISDERIQGDAEGCMTGLSMGGDGSLADCATQRQTICSAASSAAEFARPASGRLHNQLEVGDEPYRSAAEKSAKLPSVFRAPTQCTVSESRRW